MFRLVITDFGPFRGYLLNELRDWFNLDVAQALAVTEGQPLSIAERLTLSQKKTLRKLRVQYNLRVGSRSLHSFRDSEARHILYWQRQRLDQNLFNICVGALDLREPFIAPLHDQKPEMLVRYCKNWLYSFDKLPTKPAALKMRASVVRKMLEDCSPWTPTSS